MQDYPARMRRNASPGASGNLPPDDASVDDAFDPGPWRRDTPAAAAGRIHLNNAGASLMPAPVFNAIQAHLRLEMQLGGYEAADAAESGIAEAYEDVASLLGARARNVAFVENATVAFAQALTAFDFAAGDVLVTTRNDYISNQLNYLALQRRLGLRVEHAADLPEGGVDPDSVRELVRRHAPKLVALTWVPTNSGLVQRAEDVGRICREEGVPYLVDACQAIGQIPIDVGRLHCDFLSATARKFLRGPRGSGFLFVSDAALDRGCEPLFIDMRGARWTGTGEYTPADSARRFENWEFAWSLVLGTGAAARYAARVGVAPAGRYAAALAARLRDRVSAIPGARVLDRGGELCAIATVAFEDHDAADIVGALREEAINTSATYREYARFDMDEKDAESAVRISPHYFNTERDVDLAAGALEQFGRGG
jgi:selenocysteine lyase/cysteine desulfurase